MSSSPQPEEDALSVEEEEDMVTMEVEPFQEWWQPAAMMGVFENGRQAPPAYSRPHCIVAPTGIANPQDSCEMLLNFKKTYRIYALGSPINGIRRTSDLFPCRTYLAHRS